MGAYAVKFVDTQLLTLKHIVSCAVFVRGLFSFCEDVRRNAYKIAFVENEHFL